MTTTDIGHMCEDRMPLTTFSAWVRKVHQARDWGEKRTARARDVIMRGIWAQFQLVLQTKLSYNGSSFCLPLSLFPLPPSLFLFFLYFFVFLLCTAIERLWPELGINNKQANGKAVAIGIANCRRSKCNKKYSSSVTRLHGMVKI